MLCVENGWNESSYILLSPIIKCKPCHVSFDKYKIHPHLTCISDLVKVKSIIRKSHGHIKQINPQQVHFL